MRKADGIGLVWAPTGVRPSPEEIRRRERFSTFREAMDAARKRPDKTVFPWLYASAWFGPGLFDIRDIAILECVYNEGADDACR